MSVPETPSTRDEIFFNAVLTGDETGLPAPATRIEEYLNAIVTGDGSAVPAPSTRVEEYLAAIVGKGTVAQALDAAFPTITDADVVSIDDGDAGMPVRSLKIAINPVQDLHGYDSPWPAGGGKNLFNVADESSVGAGVTFTFNNNTLSCTGTASESSQKTFTLTQEIPAGTHTLSVVMDTGSKAIPQIGVSFENGTEYMMGYPPMPATLTHESPIIGFVVLTHVGDEYATTVSSIQIESGSSATSWVPYSNICPISGWTGANIFQRKNNLFDGTYVAASIVTSAYRYDTSVLGRTAIVRIKGGEQYFIKKFESSNRFKILWSATEPVNGDYPNFIFDGDTTVAKLIDTPEEANYLIIFVSTSSQQAEPPMLVALAGSTTDYEEYVGKTYIVSWQSEAGTVHVGTLTDNGNGTWTLKKLFGLLEMDGSQNLSVDNARQSNTTFTCYIRLDALERKDGDYRKALIASTMPPLSACAYSTDEYLQEADSVSIGITGYRPVDSSVASNYIYFSFRKSDYPSVVDASTAKSWFESNPTQIVYMLTEPESYTLTSESVKTLLGDNVLFADCGPIEEISYRTDPDIVRAKFGEE